MKRKYAVCPVIGKTSADGDFNGFIYCHTETTVCNYKFDYTKKDSLRKDSTYTCNYIPKLSQNNALLLEDCDASIILVHMWLINYEKNKNEKCPYERSQSREEKKALFVEKDII